MCKMSNFYKVFAVTFAFLLAMWATQKISNELAEVRLAILKQTVVQEQQLNIQLKQMIIDFCAGPGEWQAEKTTVKCY